MGIYSIKKSAATKTKGKDKSAGVGIRASYLRVVGIQVDTEGPGEDHFLRQNMKRYDHIQALHTSAA